MRLSTVLGWVVIALIPVALLLIAASALWPGTRALEGAAFLGFWSFLCSLAALPCAVCFERGRKRALMASGIATACATLLVCAALTWLESWIGTHVAASTARLASPIFIWAGWCSIVGLVLLRRTTSRAVIWLRRTTLVLTTVLGITVVSTLLVTDGVRGDNDEILRVIGSLAVLTAFGLASTLLVVRLLDRGSEGEEVARLEFAVTCPRCGVRQRIQTGGAACSACGLGIRVLVP